MSGGLRPPRVWPLIGLELRDKNERVGRDERKPMIDDPQFDSIIQNKGFGSFNDVTGKINELKWPYVSSPIALERNTLEQNGERHRVLLIETLQNTAFDRERSKVKV